MTITIPAKITITNISDNAVSVVLFDQAFSWTLGNKSVEDGSNVLEFTVDSVEAVLYYLKQAVDGVLTVVQAAA